MKNFRKAIIFLPDGMADDPLPELNGKTPLEYATIPTDLKDLYYTAQIGDFIVFDEVDDVVTTSKEFNALQSKYRANGMVITDAVANINGMSVDNVTMTNMG